MRDYNQRRLWSGANYHGLAATAERAHEFNVWAFQQLADRRAQQQAEYREWSEKINQMSEAQLAADAPQRGLT